MSDKQSGDKKPGEWAPDTAPADAKGVGPKGDAPADVGDFRQDSLGAVRFVPLIGAAGWRED